jgi:formiminoglutamase
MADIVEISRGETPLLLSIPHTGTLVPPEIEADLVSLWLARKDTDWWIERLYDFAKDMGVTIVRATHSRSVIDANRDPSGASLYSGLVTTSLCPTETFDGERLYKLNRAPDSFEIERRRRLYFQPYHSALTNEITRLKEKHPRLVLLDCHSIRSKIPRLFEGELPHMNLGTHSGATCDAAFAHVIQAVCDASGFSWTSNARFKGGWIIRSHGRPALGVHAIQIELACRSYLNEPIPAVDATNWPPPYDEEKAKAMQGTLRAIFKACLSFSRRAEA